MNEKIKLKNPLKPEKLLVTKFATNIYLNSKNLRSIAILETGSWFNSDKNKKRKKTTKKHQINTVMHLRCIKTDGLVKGTLQQY